MPFRMILHPISIFPLIFVLVLLLFSPLSAKTHPALDTSYVSALAAADHFLQAWQSGDIESGMALLTGHAKEGSRAEVLKTFFSNPEPSAYEIERGKLLNHGRYDFPVVLVTGDAKNARPRRRFSSIVVVNTGNNDWAVDKLP